MKRLLHKLWCKYFAIWYCEKSPTFNCEENPIPVTRTRYIVAENSLDRNPLILSCFDYHCLYCERLIHTYVE